MSINPAAAPVAILPSVEPGLVHRAAVSFLDQFISRGAGQDVRQLRDQLVSDGRTKRRCSISYQGRRSMSGGKAGRR